MAELVIQYSSSTAWQSSVIRRLCHSPFSHVDLVLSDGLLGASGVDKDLGDVGGVRVRPFDPWPYRLKVQARIDCTDEVYDKVVANAKSQIGKPFDNDALWSFISDKSGDRDWRGLDQWFCSELVIWSMEEAGFFSYPLAVCKNRVSPADSLLLLNPYIKNIEDILKVYGS